MIRGKWEGVVDEPVHRMQEVQSPEWDYLQRLYVLFDLMFWLDNFSTTIRDIIESETYQTKIIGRLDNHVPLDRFQVIDHIATTSRDTTAFVGPCSSIYSHDM